MKSRIYLTPGGSRRSSYARCVTIRSSVRVNLHRHPSNKENRRKFDISLSRKFIRICEKFPYNATWAGDIALPIFFLFFGGTG